MAVQQEIWRDYIAEQLYRNNDFLQFVKKVDDSRIMNGKTVHIPQAATLPTVYVDNHSLPYNVAVRTDTESSYDLSVFRTAPLLLPDYEQAEVSYDKMASIWKGTTDALSQRVGDYFFYWLLYNGGSAWVPGTDSLKTGDGGTANDGTNNSPVYTANRHKLAIADLHMAAYIMDKQGVPTNDRICVLPSVMYHEITAEIGATSVANMNIAGQYNPGSNNFASIAGFKLVQRPLTWFSTAVTTYTAVAPANFLSPVNTYCHVAFCFQTEFVEFALGETKVFETKDSATHFGSIYSGEVRAGGRPVYTGNSGVVPIFQSAT